jgi:hypothetical protein
MADTVFEEMTAKEEFLTLIAQGVAPINAGIQVSWSPAKTRAMLRDAEFAEMVKDMQDCADGEIVQALFSRAKLGNVSAIQMWLFNRKPDEWRDVKRIEVRSEHKVQIGMVESTKAAVLDLLRDQGVGAMQALGPGTVIDVEEA